MISISEPENANIKDRVGLGDDGIVHHVMYLVRENRNIRDRKYKDMWDKFERTFRGQYSGEDRIREGERSKLVSPALMAAVESISATIEDAIFSRENWFDTLDNVEDQQKQDMTAAHKLLHEDFELASVPDQISKIILNGCLYGTGIGKINVTRREIRTRTPQGIKKEFRPLVTLEAIPPWEFVIDSQARDIDSGYFVAHETNVPKNVIWTKIKNGTYKEANLLSNNTTSTISPAGEETPDGQRKSEEFDGSAFITEYYGLIPTKMLREAGVKFEDDEILGNAHVECIVTIANEIELLRVIVNPFDTKDRPIVAYQHTYLPGHFWGRGAAEKAWNSQRGLDAELRARMDALGLLTSPMIGADITRLPNNSDMRVRPGKVWLTRGNPAEVLTPISLGNIDPNTFNQSSEMERLVQVATGAIESNAPLNTDRRNETASGISMIQSSALKRIRRTMWNIERQLLNPFIRKAYHRYMQFNPERYQQDIEFVVKGTLAIVAREYEQSQLTALLSVMPPEAPTYNIVLRSIIELSGTPKRDEILMRMDEASKPDPKQQQMQEMMQQIALASAQEELKTLQMKNAKVRAEIEKLTSEKQFIDKQKDLEDEKVDIQAANTVIGHNKVKATFETNDIARARNDIERIKAKNKPKTSK